MAVVVLLALVPRMCMVMLAMLGYVVVGVGVVRTHMVMWVLVLMWMPVAVCMRVRVGMHPDARMFMRMFVFMGVLMDVFVAVLVIALHDRSPLRCRDEGAIILVSRNICPPFSSA
jgi:hypothetical protein